MTIVGSFQEKRRLKKSKFAVLPETTSTDISRDQQLPYVSLTEKSD